MPGKRSYANFATQSEPIVPGEPPLSGLYLHTINRALGNIEGQCQPARAPSPAPPLECDDEWRDEDIVVLSDSVVLDKDVSLPNEIFLADLNPYKIPLKELPDECETFYIGDSDEEEQPVPFPLRLRLMIHGKPLADISGCIEKSKSVQATQLDAVECQADISGCTEKNKSVQAAQLDAVECREYDECYSKLVHCLHDPNLMQPVQFKQNADESNSVHNSHVDNNLMQIDQLHVEDGLNLVRHFEKLVRDEVFTSKSAHKLSDPNLMQTDQNNIGETLQDCIDFDELMNDFHSSTASLRQSLSDHGSFDSGLLRDATHNGNLANSPAEAVYNAHLPGSFSQDK